MTPDLSHFLEVGGEGTAVPAPYVSPWDMVKQNYRQQVRVDAEFALQRELELRWQESLRALGEGYSAPSNRDFYKTYAEHTQGLPFSRKTHRVAGTGMGAFAVPIDLTQDPDFQAIQRANDAIKKLGRSDVKTFEQILEEVAQMQKETELETAEMSEGAGTTGNVVGMLGAMAGSFSIRDPLNVVTAPIGVGRTAATRIFSDMVIGGAVASATESSVMSNRALVGLPERDPLFNIAAAALGAGVIRGGIEGAGYGLRRLRENAMPDDAVDFDLRDSLMQQMFADNAERPSARAAASLLDDTTFMERNNPWGESRAAQERFIAELASVQRAMNGEPMTAVGRVLPPIPFEELRKVADFEIVKERAPQIYARLEETQAKVAELRELVDNIAEPAPVRAAELPVTKSSDQSYQEIWDKLRNGKLTSEDMTNSGLSVLDLEANIVPAYLRGDINTFDEFKAALGRGAEEPESLITAPKVSQKKTSSVRDQYRDANKEYQTAYRAVEAEAARLRAEQTARETLQQDEASNILAASHRGRPFIGPLLRYDNVAALVDRINAYNETLDEASVARFVREAEGEGEEAVAREAWKTEDGRIDIGLREPVDPDFRVPTEDGKDISIAEAMRDLQDDADLVEAIKVCAI